MTLLHVTRQSFSRRLFSAKKKSSGGSNGGNGSIFKKMVENFKDTSADPELKTSLKQFEQKLTEINELESIKKAKEIISQAKADVSKQNEAILSEMKQKVKAIKDTTDAAATKIGETLSAATKPVREAGEKLKEYVPNITETELGKKVSKTVSEAESKIFENTNIYQYGGFKSKSDREKFRKSLENDSVKQAVSSESSCATESSENPDAGSAIVPTKQSGLSKFWSSFKDSNILLNRLRTIKQNYDESNNVFVYFTREITDRIGHKFASMFAENDTARAMRELKERDPTFNSEAFMKTAREYIIPEILDALLTADIPTLRTWCSEATFNVLKANFEMQLKPGIVFSGKVLDLRNLELVLAKVLDDRPVLVFSFNTQQTSVVKDSKGAVIDGSEDSIENITYVMALGRDDASTATEKGKSSVAKGWKLVEMAIRDRNGSW